MVVHLGGGASLYVEVNEVPELSLTSTATVCNSEDTGQSTSINLEDYVLASAGNLEWQSLSSLTFSGNLPIIDLNGVEPGDYSFAVSTTTASLPCLDPTVYLTLTVEDCDCPNLDLAAPDPICNSNDQLDLNTYLSEFSAAIDWSLDDYPSATGYTPVSLDNSLFSLNGAAPGDYSFSVVYTGTAPIACDLENDITIQIVDQLSAGTETEGLSLCSGSANTIDLRDLLSGEDDSGIWTEVSSNPSQNGSFEPLDGQFSTGDQVPGEYLFEYAIDAEEPCIDQSTIVTVEILELPEADAGLPGFISCSEPFYDLEAVYNNDYLYSWTLDGLVLSENPYYSAEEIGQYILAVEDPQSGCISKDSVIVEGFFTNPEMEVELSDVKCYGEANGQISILSTSGGEAPYLFSFEGGAFESEEDFGALVSGTYSLIVEDLYGCTDSMDIFIGQPDPLELDIDFDYNQFDNGMLGLGDSIELEAYINIDEELIDDIQWSPSNMVNCDTCLSVVAFPDQSSFLSLSVDVSTCNVRETIQLLVRKDYSYYVPNIVSFNDDGVNDVFYVFGGSEIKRINRMQVYDRWGGMVFSNENFGVNDPSEGWDGKKLGQNAASGVYAYLIEIEFIDGKIEVAEGSITVRK